MSYTLSVYTDNTFKEMFLPSISNADYTLVLERADFAVASDILVKMEVFNDRWVIYSTPDYTLLQNAEHKDKIIFKSKNSFKLVTVDGTEFSFVVIESERSIETIGKYDVANASQIIIGKDSNCDIVYEGIGLVSRNHAKITNINGRLFVEDSSLNGTFVGTQRISGKKALRFGDCINIFGLHIVVLGDMIAINASYGAVQINKTKLKEAKKDYYAPPIYRSEVAKKEYFHRSPRNTPVINEDTVAIEAAPAPKVRKDRPIWMTAGPAMTMALPMLLGCSIAIAAMNKSGGGSAFMYTGIITAVASAIVGVVWAIINMKYAKKKDAEEEQNRFERYSDYLVKIADDLKNKYQQNIAALYQIYPSADECSAYINNTALIWSRNKTHSDFLFHRLGIGDIPFQVKIVAPEERFSLINDDLASKPQLLKNSYKTLQNVPVGIDLLENHLIGIIGDDKKKAVEIARALAVQIAANNCYTDVKMVFIYDGADRELVKEWNFAKWLPHVWSEDKKSRYLATNKIEAGDVFYELAKVIRTRAEDEKNVKPLNNEKICPKPYYVMFVSDPKLLEDELISKYIFNAKDTYGITTILIDESYENLPNSCEHVIENSSSFTGAYSMMGGPQSGKPINFDYVSSERAENFARQLLKIEVMEIENGGEIPNSLSFFDMYNVTSLEQFNVVDRWRKNRTYDSMKALIGKKAGNSDCYLDIHEKYHGPHGLIAGTTGSGKSETLQTYILSLALNYSPEDVAFFVIDFKGGGMANLFNKLPHMIGQISNLSGNQIRRAMLSIKSENLRRQRIFSEFGVNHINSYTRLLKNQEASEPIPHLFIIIDEFAELKREEPEFMRELISVAQVGRSLGVHLILATQKPSGTVDDNIWSNSKFRLCLRVQDRQDSFDMLHKHDAAYLTNSGRCFLQVGNDEIFELFQSGWSGAVYDENMSNRADIATMLDITGKAAVVGNRIKFKQKENMRHKFLALIAAHLLNAKDLINADDSDILNSASVRASIAEKAYDSFAKANIDYQFSTQNVQRLSDFLMSIVSYNDCDDLDDKVNYAIADSRANNWRLPDFKDKTQLDAVVEYIEEIAVKNNYKTELSLWMPVLPSHIYLEDMKGYSKYNNGWQQKDEWTLDVVAGLCDDPENQSQYPLHISFSENGNHAVCGMVVSGKSTFMQSVLFALISKYSPEQLNIYALDFSSRMLGCFEKSPHFGGVMFENDTDKIGKFFNMIEAEFNMRKELLKGGTFQQYVHSNNNRLPAIIIAIDNYANFREKTNNEYDDIMMRISRDGVGYGLFLFISSSGFGATEIPNRMADNIRTVVCLEMGDKFKYIDTMHVSHLEVMPENDVKGRGIANISGSILEFQTALALRAADDYEKANKIEEICFAMNDSWNGKRAVPIPEIPEKPVWSEFCESDAFKVQLSNPDLLPFAYNAKDASIYSVDLLSTYCYMVSGKSRSGKTNCLKNMIRSAALQNCDICIMDSYDEALRGIAQECNAKYILTPREAFDYWSDLIPVFKARNAKKREMLADGMDDNQIYESMKSEKRLYIFISDYAEFIKRAYQAGDGFGACNGFLENIMEKGSLHNIYFIGCINSDNTAQISAYALYNIITSYKAGVHFGGNMFKQKIFDFSALPFNEQNRSLKPGIGMICANENIVKIVVPDSRR